MKKKRDIKKNGKMKGKMSASCEVFILETTMDKWLQHKPKSLGKSLTSK